MKRKSEEKKTQNAILKALGSRSDLRLWRQNVGVAVPIGELRSILKRELGPDRAQEVLRACPKVSFGVPGMADLSGVRDDGSRIEIEVKSPTGAVKPEQRKFGAMMDRFGGVFGIARSVEEAEEIVRRR